MTPLHQFVAAVRATQTPRPTPSCPQAPDLCHWMYQQTGQAWLAEGSYWFLVKPLRVVLIIGLAILARTLIHRMISRLVRSTADSSPALLRPLRQKMPGALLRDAGMLPERRRQRAEALGSVLRSVASAVIFVVALMLVFGELGFDLAPLLTSAGIAGLAIGFGAQNLVKDFVTGLFMLLEDQYGVGDVVDVGQASGTVEAVGLRVTTIRDSQGVVWYIRNGEISRVGNKSQGWAQVVVDIPVGFAGVQEAAEILRTAAARLAEDPEWSDEILEAPEVLGVEQITADGAVLRTTVKTTSELQGKVGRELRRCLTEALDKAGIAERMGAGRVLLQPLTAGLPDPSTAGVTAQSPATDGFPPSQEPAVTPQPPTTGGATGAPGPADS